MAHKSTSSSAPVLIDPPTGWETATNISNWHLIPSVDCLDQRGIKNVRSKGGVEHLRPSLFVSVLSSLPIEFSGSLK